MKTKVPTIFLVSIMICLSGLTALGQAGQSHKTPEQSPEQKLAQVFKNIVGRDPSPAEVTCWKAQFCGSYGQIIDWFVAPEQASERAAMVDRAYQQYFKRPANSSEKTAVGNLVQQKKILFSEMLATIGIQIDITGIADVAGDPHALKVTLFNLSSVTTSSKSFVGIRFYDGANCVQGTATEWEKSEVPAIAPQQSATVKLINARVVQQTNTQHPSFALSVSGGDNSYSALSSVNNTYKCVPRLTIQKSKGTGTTNPILKGQSPAINHPPPTKKP